MVLFGLMVIVMFINNEPPDVVISDDSNGRSAPTNVTNVLTLTNVSISDNGTVYICGQGIGSNAIASDPSILTVLGKYTSLNPSTRIDDINNFKKGE